MLLRNATIDDLPAIVEIYNSTIASRMVTAETLPVTVEEKTGWFHSHHTKRPLWVTTEKAVIIAWVSLQDFYDRPAYENTAEISIYLHKDFRGKGLGKTILKDSIDKASAAGLKCLLGIIFSHNIPSLQLFKSLGFASWGLMPEIACMDNQYYSVEILGLKI